VCRARGRNYTRRKFAAAGLKTGPPVSDIPDQPEPTSKEATWSMLTEKVGIRLRTLIPGIFDKENGKEA